jgi:hypothetical protein
MGLCSAATFALLLFCVNAAIEEKKSNQKWDQLDGLLQKADEIVKEIEADEDEGPPDNAPAPTSGRANPCESHRCPWGKECIVTEAGRPHCDCVRHCPDVTPEPDEMVCSNKNETFNTICHLYQQRCLCRQDKTGCTNPRHKHVHLEYLGRCKEIEQCTDELLSQFPDRMADWLFQVMKDLNARRELHGAEWVDLIQQSEQDDHLKHVYPVIWKFCDLDKKPHDKYVVPHELIPITAPVIPMESCIKPFLESCDGDKDDKITLKEWGKCLGLKEGDIIEKC